MQYQLQLSFKHVLVLPPLSATNIMSTPQATSVILSWTQSNNDFVNNYRVNFTRIEGCASVPTKIWIISGHLRNYNFTGLEEAINYRISISATTFQNASVIVKTAASGKQFFSL